MVKVPGSDGFPLAEKKVHAKPCCGFCLVEVVCFYLHGDADAGASGGRVLAVLDVDVSRWHPRVSAARWHLAEDGGAPYRDLLHLHGSHLRTQKRDLSQQTKL